MLAVITRGDLNRSYHYNLLLSWICIVKRVGWTFKIRWGGVRSGRQSRAWVRNNVMHLELKGFKSQAPSEKRTHNISRFFVPPTASTQFPHHDETDHLHTDSHRTNTQTNTMEQQIARCAKGHVSSAEAFESLCPTITSTAPQEMCS